MSARGVPVQDLPENQDPAVRFTVNEVTGEVTHWEELRPVEDAAEAPKKRRRSQTTRATEEAPEAPAERASDPTSVREFGS